MIEQIPDNLATRLETMDEQMVAIAEALLDPAVLSDHNKVRELSVKKAALEGPVSRWREIVAADTVQLHRCTHKRAFHIHVERRHSHAQPPVHLAKMPGLPAPSERRRSHCGGDCRRRRIHRRHVGIPSVRCGARKVP